jgi:hypothetical protein
MDDLYGPLDEKKKKRKKAGTESGKESSLKDWFGRKGAKGSKKGWVDCNAPDGKGGYKACGRGSGEKRKKYPACRPTPGACKERGRGKSWGKKAKKKKNEDFNMNLEKVVREEIEALISEAESKKDACYHKVKSRYKVWPSAYASGALVKCRKVGAKNWGNSKKEDINESHTEEHEEELEKIVGELENASKMHASQAERVQKILDDTDNKEEIEEIVGQETSKKLSQAGIAKQPERVRKELMDMILGLDTGDPEDVEKLSDLAAALLPASAVNVKQGLGLEEKVTESLNCGCGNDPCETYGKDNEKLVIMVKEEIQSHLREKTQKDRMKCNSPRRISKGEPGHGKKKFVVKACDGGTEKIIRYGDANMEIKKDNPKRRKSFRARHNCKNPGSKLKARYWSCKKW